MWELVPKIAGHMELLKMISLKHTLRYGVCPNNEYFIGQNEYSSSDYLYTCILVLYACTFIFIIALDRST